MKGMRKSIIAALGLFLPVFASAQPVPEPKPAAQGSLFLPVALKNPVFNNLTSILGQVDGCFQLPVLKGFGLGLGVNATFYELNETGLAVQLPTLGHVNRILYYGKLDYLQYTGPVTFFQLDAKFGHGTWYWNCSTCSYNAQQPGFHWGVDAGYFVHASDNLAFGLTVGYDADATSFGPEVIGLERFPGRTDTGSPYRFLTVGLGFSTGFAKAKDGMW